jgi:hypothetical protein
VSEIMNEIENVGVGDRIHHVRHRGVVAAHALILVQRLHEVIPALALSAIFLRHVERVTLRIVVSAAMIVGGVLLITLSK